MYRIQERALRIVYNDRISAFNQPPDKYEKLTLRTDRNVLGHGKGFSYFNAKHI